GFRSPSVRRLPGAAGPPVVTAPTTFFGFGYGGAVGVVIEARARFQDTDAAHTVDGTGQGVGARQFRCGYGAGSTRRGQDQFTPQAMAGRAADDGGFGPDERPAERGVLAQ